jgi:hypothetical protein
MRWSGLLGALLVGLLAANLLGPRLRQSRLYHLDVGFWGDQELLCGFWEQEHDASGATYRWTTAQSSFFVRGFAVTPHPVLELGIGGIPPKAPSPRVTSVRIDGAALVVPVAAAPRRYHLLPPRGALLDGNLLATFASETSRVAPDPREVGIRVDDIALGWGAGDWVLPPWQTLLVELAAALVWLGVAWRLEPPVWSQGAIAAGLVGLLGWMTQYNLLMATAWETRMLAGGVVLLGLACTAFPLLDRLAPELGARREMRKLGAIAALAVGIRLLAIYYPPFGSHDLYIHRDRLLDVQLGSLQLWDTPSEFAGQRTIVPSAFYVLASPLTLLTANPGVAIQGLYAFLEGTSALLLAILVRRLGGSARAALIAAIAIATLPIQFTALWWGFGPQIVGQWLLLLVAALVAGRGARSRGFWLAGGAALSLAFLMHDGVAILGGVWLLAYVLLVRLRYPRARDQWLGWGAALAGSTAVATLLLYADVIGLHLRGFAAPPAKPQSFDEALRLLLLSQGLLSSLRPLGAGLTVLSLGMLVWRTRTTHRLLVIGWLLSAGLFLSVDVLLGLQVRYGYFAIPMVCAGLGLLLDRLMAGRRLGVVAGWCLVAIIAWNGIGLWIAGVFLYIKPTLTALTH